jgi:DNA-binding NtrC family response regulator
MRLFRFHHWRLDQVATCREAILFVRQNETAVVICERHLPDGDWKTVLKGFEELPVRSSLIVTSYLADDALWAEVLNTGGYDVLAQPFDRDEVYRVVLLAWHHGRRRAGA